MIDLKHATGFTHLQLVRVSHIEVGTLRCLMRGYRVKGKPMFPDLITVERIRLMEQAFEKELRKYRARPGWYDRLSSPDNHPETIFDPIDGERVVYVRDKNLPKPHLYAIDMSKRPDLMELLKPSGVVGTKEYRAERLAEYRRIKEERRMTAHRKKKAIAAIVAATNANADTNADTNANATTTKGRIDNARIERNRSKSTIIR